MPLVLDPPRLAGLRLPSPPPLVRALYVLNGLMLALAVAGFVASELAGAPRWSFVRVGDEGNLPTWFSSAQLLLVGLGLGVLAARDVRRGRLQTWPLAVGPALFVLFSLDEAAMLHERLGDWMQAATGAGEGLRTGPWMFLYAPLVGLALWATVRAYRPYWRGRTVVVGLALAGVLVYGGAAVGLEFAANFVGDGSLAQKALGLVEEIGEMVGVTTLVWAVAALLRAEGVRLEVSGPKV